MNTKNKKKMNSKNEKNGIFFKVLPWLMLAVALFTYTLKKESYAVESFNTANLLRIFLVSTSMVLSIFNLILRPKEVINLLVTPPFIFLMIYAFFSLISGSYASHPFYSIWKSIEFISCILAAGSFASQEMRVLIKSHKVIIIYLHIIFLTIIIGAIISPSYSFIHIERAYLPYQLQGFILPINPNSVGLISAFIAVNSISNIFDKFYQKRNYFNYLLLILSLIALIFSQSRTSLFAFILSFILAEIFFKKKFWIFITSVFGIFLMLMKAIDSYIVKFVMRGQSEALFFSFSGRIIMWKKAWKFFLKSPYLGHGMGSAGRFDLLKGGACSTLHGSVFEVAVSTGIIGLFLWGLGLLSEILFIIKIIKNLHNIENSHKSIIIKNILFISIIFIRSITSSDLATFSLGLVVYLGSLAIITSCWYFCKI